jgi:hypothetical protein
MARVLDSQGQSKLTLSLFKTEKTLQATGGSEVWGPCIGV